MAAHQMDDKTRKSREQLALSQIQAQLDLFAKISLDLSRSFGFWQSRLKSKFPKNCGKCGKSYKSFEEFYYGTEGIAEGTVNYPTVGAEFYLHRNCPHDCGSTLVVVFNDRRDETVLGLQRRELFRDCARLLQENLGLNDAAANEVLFSLLKQRVQS